MYKYLVFAYDQYYPFGGMNDLKGVFETKKGAEMYASSIEKSWDMVDVVSLVDGEISSYV